MSQNIKLKLNKSTPSNEDRIVIAYANGRITSGVYWFDDGGGYYDDDGEEIEDVIGWVKYPVLSFSEV